MKNTFKPCRELHRLDMHICRALEKIGDMPNRREITGANGRIIRFLSEHEGDPIYQKDIEKAFGITRSTASRVLMLMEQKGLIQRSGVSHDARLKQVTLTERSQAFSHTMCERGRLIDEQLMAGFTDAEKLQLASFIQRMHDNLK